VIKIQAVVLKQRHLLFCAHIAVQVFMQQSVIIDESWMDISSNAILNISIIKNIESYFRSLHLISYKKFVEVNIIIFLKTDNRIKKLNLK
jgi:hypothetical protein